MKKWLRRLLGLLVLYALAIITCGITARPLPADIAVVLGNEVLADGTPSPRLAARVDCALALWREKKVQRIMVSGGKGKNGFDEATVMAAHLRKQGVPQEDIIVDSLGVNTMATARNTRALMESSGYKSAVIVTQYYHIPRTEMAFLMAGVTSFTADYPVYLEWRDAPSLLREMIAIPAYLLTDYHQNNG